MFYPFNDYTVGAIKQPFKRNYNKPTVIPKDLNLTYQPFEHSETSIRNLSLKTSINVMSGRRLFRRFSDLNVGPE